MLIECPFCKTAAKIADEQEGAKVRCAQCKKVYVANEKGSTSAGAKPLQIALVALGVLLVVVIIAVVNHSTPPPEAAPKVEPPKAEPKVDTVGWNSAAVSTVRDFFDAAFARDPSRLRSALAGAKLALDRKPTDPAELAHWIPFEARGSIDQENFLSGVAQEIVKDSDDFALRLWKPFDGSVTHDEGSQAAVRVKVSPRDPKVGAESHSFDFDLVKNGSSWKVAGWKRVITEAEANRAKRAKTEELQKVEYSDGTTLYTAEPRHLEHFADTAPEVRAKVDQLFKQMTDFKLAPKENNRALEELVTLGRPALPILLTGMYEIKIVDDDTAGEVNLINQALERITGHNTGFTPSNVIGSNEERRTTSIRAWFGWWVRYGESFGKPTPKADAAPKDPNHKG